MHKKKKKKLEAMKKKFDMMKKKEEERKRNEIKKQEEMLEKIKMMEQDLEEKKKKKNEIQKTKLNIRLRNFIPKFGGGGKNQIDDEQVDVIKKLKKMSYFENIQKSYNNQTSSFIDGKTLKLIEENNFYVNLDGKIACEKIDGKQGLVILYRSVFGKKLFKKLFTKKEALLPKLISFYKKSELSKKEISKFITAHKIDMSEFEMNVEKYTNFNDFFVRKLKKGKRSFEKGDDVAVSPADSKVYVIKDLSKKSFFFIKNTLFNINDFVKDDKLAQKFKAGTMYIFRLAPYDYHRYHFPVSGVINGEMKVISTVGNESVNPLVYKTKENPLIENERHICVLESEHFGDVLVCSVGAMIIGKIIETFIFGKKYEKGDEMGYFEYGGSTVVIIFQKDKIIPLQSFVENSNIGLETQVKMGMRINELQKKESVEE